MADDNKKEVERTPEQQQVEDKLQMDNKRPVANPAKVEKEMAIAADFREKADEDSYHEIGNRKDRVGVARGAAFTAQTEEQLGDYEQATGRKWSESLDRPVAKDVDTLGINPGGEPQDNNAVPVDFEQVQQQAQQNVERVESSVEDTKVSPQAVEVEAARSADATKTMPAGVGAVTVGDSVTPKKELPVRENETTKRERDAAKK